MNRHGCAASVLRVGVAALAAAWLAAPARAEVERGTTMDGHAFLEGGIGQDEVRTLEGERGNYALTVITAERRHGEYLSDVHLRIMDARGTPVLDRTLTGPLLLVDLPPGRYTLEAAYRDAVRRSAVTLHPNEHRRLVIGFDVPADAVSNLGTRSP